MLHEVAGSLEPLVDRPRVRVLVHADPSLPRVATDRDKVKQILLNLLSNAIKYTDAGSIAMRAEAVDGRLRIAVSDTGIGIAGEQLDKVFLEFHRADSTRDGTGLGLTISQRLARALGGGITVESRLDAGSTFTVDLPLKP